MDDGSSRMLRSDAADNRERILEAARSLFATEGLGVTMREVARRAGVGPATLYRRFPGKQDLVTAAIGGELLACRRIVDDGAVDPDAWRGFCSVIRQVGELNARNHSLVEALLETTPASADLREHRASMLRTLAALARRAQAEGGLRSDFQMDDLVVVLRAGRGLAAGPLEWRLASARRFSALAIDAFRAPAGAVEVRSGAAG